MKPNLIIVQPPHVECDAIIDQFCETLCETHYVYLIRPISTFREDSPAGVRFLNFSPDRFPGFGEVDSVIVVDSPELAGRFQEKYPEARHALWNPETDEALPLSLVPSRSETIIQGDFGHGTDQEELLARAM